MPRSKSDISNDTEFGGSAGLIDPVRRADRVIGQEATATGYNNMAEPLWELYATNPADPAADPSKSDLDYQPRPTPTPTVDKSTAKGTS